MLSRGFDSESLALLAALPEPLLVVAADGRVRVFNQAAERLSGRSQTLVLGKPAELLFSEAARAQWQAMFAEREARGKAVAVLPLDGPEGGELLCDLNIDTFAVGEECWLVATLRANPEGEVGIESLSDVLTADDTWMQSPAAQLLLNGAGRVKRANEAALRLLGASDGKAAEAALRALEPDEGPGGLIERMQRIAPGGTERFVMRRARTEGAAEQFDITVACVQKGREQTYLVSIAEQSELLGAVDEARRGVARFRDFAMSASDWFWEMDASMRITGVSGRVEESLGIERDKLIGQTRAEIYGGGTDGESWSQHQAELRARRPFRDFRFRLKIDADRPVWISMSGVPVIEKGVFKGYRGSASNITGEMEAESRVAEAQVRLNTALEGFADGFALFDGDEGLVLSNGRFGQLYSALADHIRPGMKAEAFFDLLARQGLVDTGDEEAGRWGKRVLGLFRAGESFEYRLREGPFVRVQVRRMADGCYASVHGEITRLKEREAELEKALEEQRGLIATLPDAVVVLDQGGRLVRWNRAFEETVSRDAEALEGLALAELVPEGEREQVAETIARAIAGGALSDDFTLRGRGKALTRCHWVGVARKGPSGEPAGLIATGRDLDQSHKQEQRLRQAAKVFETTTEGVVITDASANIVAVNPAFSAITGYSESEAVGKNPRVLKSHRHDEVFYQELWKSLSEDGIWQGEIWNRRKNGEIYPEWLTVNAVRDGAGNIENYVGVFTDISALKSSQERLQHLAHHDALTGLPNRLLLQDRLQHAIKHADRDRHSLGVLFLDHDHFKNVNDSLGHPVGDQVLKEIAERLVGTVRENDTVARLGGDEFVILLEEVRDTEAVQMVTRKVLDLFEKEIVVEGNDIRLSTSIGVSLYPRDGADAETLLKHADSAMYRAKEKGRNTSQFYTQEISTNAFERYLLETNLRRAVSEQEFTLYYQPQFSLDTGTLAGAEALIRWQHPDLGIVSPTRFIPLAEEIGLIEPIGSWVLRSACAQMKAWFDEGYRDYHIAVNLSGLQIQRGRIVDIVKEVLEETGLEPRLLELEITESFIMRQEERAVEVLDSLRALGVSLAIDDFGTGYSSLTYLKRLPVNKIKIDRSFVKDIPTDANDEAIARAIIVLAHSLQLTVVAEGVETAAQQSFLREQNCDGAQGFLYSEPVPAEVFAEQLRRVEESKKQIVGGGA